MADPTAINGAAQSLGALGRSAQPQPSSVEESFGTLLGQALQNLSAIEHQSDEAAARLAAGEPVDLHDVLIATEEASIAFQLALQVRNKAVEAYQEIMRMQV